MLSGSSFSSYLSPSNLLQRITQIFHPIPVQQRFWQAMESASLSGVLDSLAKGADLHALNERGQSALYAAVHGGDGKVKENIAIALVDRGAKFTAEENQISLLFHLLDQGAWKLVEVLLKRSVNLDQRDVSNRTLMHHAAKDGEIERVKRLIGLGASVDVQDEQYATPLHLAAQKGHIDVVRSLLREKGRINVNALDEFGRTALWLAANNGHNAVVEILLEAGADPNLADKKGQTPLVVALYDNKTRKEPGRYHVQVANTLIRGGASIKPLINCMHPFTLLEDTVVMNALTLTRALVRNGVSVQTKEMGSGMTLLHKVLKRRPAEVVSSELIEQLLQCGFEVDVADNLGNSPLHYATNTHDAALLLSRGAMLEEMNKDLWSPLFCAANQGNLDLVKLYLERGANPYHLDVRQQCIIQVARGSRKSTPISDFLKDKIRIKPDVMLKMSGLLQNIIIRSKEAAERQGKKLLLILGETHNDYRAFQVEKLIGKLAKDRGISDMFIEHTAISVMLAKGDNHSLRSYMPFMKAKKQGFNLMGVDNDRTDSVSMDCSAAGLKKRNLRIRKDIEKYVRHAILITGSAHMHGLMSVPETQIDRNSFFIVPLCLSFQEDMASEHSADIHFLRPRHNVIQITEKGFDPEQAKTVIKKWNGSDLDLPQQNNLPTYSKNSRLRRVH